jgi:hypothetical protein
MPLPTVAATITPTAAGRPTTRYRSGSRCCMARGTVADLGFAFP